MRRLADFQNRVFEKYARTYRLPFIDLAAEFPRIRILVVSRQSERTYAERALNAGASGYWMKNSSAQELMRAIETVLAGEVYVSPAITSLAMAR